MQNSEYASGLVGQALQPADPLSSGSSRPEGRLRAGLPAPLRFAKTSRISEALVGIWATSEVRAALEVELYRELDVAGTVARNVTLAAVLIHLPQAVELVTAQRGDVERIRIAGCKSLRDRHMEKVVGQRPGSGPVADDDLLNLRHQRLTRRGCGGRLAVEL